MDSVDNCLLVHRLGLLLGDIHVDVSRLVCAWLADNFFDKFRVFRGPAILHKGDGVLRPVIHGSVHNC